MQETEPSSVSEVTDCKREQVCVYFCFSFLATYPRNYIRLLIVLCVNDWKWNFRAESLNNVHSQVN